MLKIKARGSDARKLLDLHEDKPAQEGLVPGREVMGENPESRQAEGSNKNENSDITKKVKPTLKVMANGPEVRDVKGFSCVTPVDRALPSDSPEEARKRNNASRDARCQLGRLIPSNPIVK